MERNNQWTADSLQEQEKQPPASVFKHNFLATTMGDYSASGGALCDLRGRATIAHGSIASL
jgi:hypothetical protein